MIDHLLWLEDDVLSCADEAAAADTPSAHFAHRILWQQPQQFD
jgi:hypothetical protein